MVNPALLHLLDINPVEIQNNISKDNFNINEVGIAHNMMHNLKESNIKIFLSLALFDEKEEIVLKSDYDFIYKVDNLEENYKINDEGETVFNAMASIANCCCSRLYRDYAGSQYRFNWWFNAVW